MNKFIMMVGPFYSGKSTVAAELAIKYCGKVFSSDDIREELYGDASVQENHDKVFRILHKRIITHLLEGGTAIYDATNLNMKRRKGFLYELAQHKIECEKFCAVVVAPPEVLKERYYSRTRKVPLGVIHKQLCQFQTPFYFEGWDRIELFLNFKERESFELKKIYKESYNISQENPHHIFTIGEHMYHTVNNPTYKEVLDSNLVLRTAAEYHDIGKMYTKTYINKHGVETESAHYYGHQHMGAYLLLCTHPDELGLSSQTMLHASTLICYHMEHYTRDEKGLSKFYELIGPRLSAELTILNKCDKAAH